MQHLAGAEKLYTLTYIGSDEKINGARRAVFCLYARREWIGHRATFASPTQLVTDAPSSLSGYGCRARRKRKATGGCDQWAKIGGAVQCMLVCRMGRNSHDGPDILRVTKGVKVDVHFPFF
jgi:hypothetical protein